jgi:hypothetical protein
MPKKRLSFEEAAELIYFPTIHRAGFSGNILNVFVLVIVGYKRSKFGLKTMFFLDERFGDKSQKDFLEF